MAHAERRSSDIISLVEKEIRAWWITGGKLEELLSLCPQNQDVRQLVTNEFVHLETVMRSKRVNCNVEGPIRGRLN